MKNNRFIVYLLSLAWLFLQLPAFAAPPQISIKGQHADVAVLKNIVSTKLLQAPSYRNQQFRKIDVKVAKIAGKRKLLATLKYKNIYYYETAVISLDQKNKVEKIETNISPLRAKQIMRMPSIAIRPMCPDSSVDMVFATPEDGIPTAVQGVNNACNSARSAGYRCRTLIGNQATVKAYKSYLTNCPKLKALGNIGHGNPYGILLADGSLSHTWFNGLPRTELKGIVNYFNSCKVFNPPLKNAVMHAGTRTYIGGILNLSIGPSENVFKCFWNDALVKNKAMKPSLTDCESSKYHTAGAHGLAGDGGKFKRLVIRPPERMIRPEIMRPIPELQQKRLIPKPIPRSIQR